MVLEVQKTNKKQNKNKQQEQQKTPFPFLRNIDWEKLWGYSTCLSKIFC